MSITEHLEDLRSSVLKAGAILLVSFMLAYAFGEYISEFLLTPLREALGSQKVGNVVYLGLLDKVISQLQVALYTGIIASSPLWFYQIWAFIRPGLYDFEVKVVKPFLLVGFFLFWLGVGFGYYIVFPVTFKTLMNFGVGDVDAMISLKEYLVLASKVLVFLGIVFQLPNILIILGFMGLATKYSLRQWRRYVYVGFAVIAAMITPPDIVTMCGLWLPLAALYEVGILAVAAIVHPYLARQHRD